MQGALLAEGVRAARSHGFDEDAVGLHLVGLVFPVFKLAQHGGFAHFGIANEQDFDFAEGFFVAAYQASRASLP